MKIAGSINIEASNGNLVLIDHRNQGLSDPNIANKKPEKTSPMHNLSLGTKINCNNVDLRTRKK
jgi:hypothetical protein